MGCVNSKEESVAGSTTPISVAASGTPASTPPQKLSSAANSEVTTQCDPSTPQIQPQPFISHRKASPQTGANGASGAQKPAMVAFQNSASQAASNGDTVRVSPVTVVRPDSPDTARVASRAPANKTQAQDDILTVWDNDACQSPGAGLQSLSDEPATPVRPAKLALPGSMNSSQSSDAHEDESSSPHGGRHLPRQDSTKSTSPAILTLQSSQSAGPGGVGSSGPNSGVQDLDSIEQSLNQLGPGAKAQQQQQGVGRSRFAAPAGAEMVLTLSDEEDEDDAGASQGFMMAKWKRHYHWNKHKHQDLLKYLWKRFDKQNWSIYCMTYKAQTALFAEYQGENVIHGLQCRLQQTSASSGQQASLLDNLFGVMVTLADRHVFSSFKVVGVLIAAGTGRSPACLTGCQDMEDWLVQQADVSDPLIREFVSQLITGQPPNSQFYVASVRELM